jgi:FkbM family methyltransferase
MTHGPVALFGQWWWPADDTDARAAILRDCASDIAALLEHVPGRDLIVQAGANTGVYPLALAEEFAAVYTAEPDPTNYECLKRNLAGTEAAHRIVALNAAFGETEGECAPVEVRAHNCGAHRVAFGKGDVPVWTIDALELQACDCIFLDIEGAELLALKGAAQTIERFGPTVAVEDKGLNAAFGIGRGELQAWLAERGYAEVGRYGRDKIFRRIA